MEADTAPHFRRSATITNLSAAVFLSLVFACAFFCSDWYPEFKARLEDADSASRTEIAQCSAAGSA